jgi:hypothetical protein
MDMERAKGFEPSAVNLQPAEIQHLPEQGETDYTQIRAQIMGNDGRDLAQVVNAWAGLPAAFKAAILAIVGSNEKGGR